METRSLEIKRLMDINYPQESSNDMIEIVDIFLQAINDWPKEVLTLNDYESDIEKFIKDQTTLDNIECALKKIDYSEESWEAESLFQIKEVFVYYEIGISLKKIIQDLEYKLKDIY